MRPYVHRLPGGTWSAQMYQLQVRYQSPTAIPIRVDAGIISSPLGLATLELRQDLNPTVGPPFYYFAPLPSFDGNPDRVRLLTGGYPIGAMVSASGGSWDARAGVIDETPARKRHVFESNGRPVALQVIAGGGFSPRPGLRIGAGFGKGPYRRTSGLASASNDDCGGYETSRWFTSSAWNHAAAASVVWARRWF